MSNCSVNEAIVQLWLLLNNIILLHSLELFINHSILLCKRMKPRKKVCIFDV